MAFWKDNTAPRPSTRNAHEAAEPSQLGAKPEAMAGPALARSKPEAVPNPAAGPLGRADMGVVRHESLIGVDITFEGKIEGGGSIRIAGKFKGDVNLQGDLAIEAGAKLTGSVRADKVSIAGEMQGNVEEASRVDLQQTGVLIGDLKAGSLTVAAGARMRGQVEFGWDDDQGSKKLGMSGSGGRGAGL